MTLRELAIHVLRKENRPLSAKEIWEIAEKKGLLKKLDAKGKNPYATFTSVLYTDHKKEQRTFVEHGSDPKRFTLQ